MLQPMAQQSLSQCFLIVSLLNPWETRKEGFRFCSEILHCPQASFFSKSQSLFLFITPELCVGSGFYASPVWLKVCGEGCRQCSAYP